MNDKAKEPIRAKTALTFIIPFLEKYKFKWVITGGFACYIYGVERLLTDIDIDIDTDKDATEFIDFLSELSSYITQPLENFIDDNYDNFNFEITIDGQIIDICPMANLRIINIKTGKYELFYKGVFPEIEITDFEGFKSPLLTKQAIIENKEMLKTKDEWQIRDIKELRKLL